MKKIFSIIAVTIPFVIYGQFTGKKPFQGEIQRVGNSFMIQRESQIYYCSSSRERTMGPSQITCHKDLSCYQCCVGEVDKECDEDFHNYRYAQKGKNCNC